MANDQDIERYLFGQALYGDDLAPEEIANWIKDEENAYISLTKSYGNYAYAYHALNQFHGFRYLAGMAFDHALAFGCARGDEVEPIAERVARFTAMEPADGFWTDTIAGTPARYLKPNPNGDIPSADREFSLITCLGVLHHIPNVSHILSEFHRVLAPGGMLVMREPISSMGDWRKKRRGLTKRERGLPIEYLDRVLPQLGFIILQERFCMFPLTSRLARILREPCPFNNKKLVLLDAVLSGLFKFNLHYHRDKMWKKIAPGSIFLVAQKKAP